MKKSFYSLVLACTVAFAQPIACGDHKLSLEHITEYKKEFSQQVKKRELARKGVKLAMAGAVMYVAYSVYDSFFGEGTAAATAAQAVASNDSYLTQFGDWISSGGTWLNFGKFATTSVIGGVVAGQMRHVMEEETVLWFVMTQAPYTATIRGIAWYAQKASLDGIPLDERQHAILKRQCAMLTKQCEQIIGFMEWKADQLTNKEAQDDAHAIAHELFDECNQKLLSIDSAITKNNALLAYHSDSLFLVLQHECARFAQVEGSNWIDPHMLLAIANQLS
jgi:hypothetical protein